MSSLGYMEALLQSNDDMHCKESDTGNTGEGRSSVRLRSPVVVSDA